MVVTAGIAGIIINIIKHSKKAVNDAAPNDSSAVKNDETDASAPSEKKGGCR